VRNGLRAVHNAALVAVLDANIAIDVRSENERLRENLILDLGWMEGRNLKELTLINTLFTLAQRS
jgi:hypothetical protein